MVGDRYEAMAIAIAATFQNVCLIHLEGGEVSGSIDESIRHAITKLATLSLPCDEAGRRVHRADGRASGHHLPAGMSVPRRGRRRAGYVLPRDMLEQSAWVDARFRGALPPGLFHPVTTDIGTQEEQIEAVLRTLLQLGMQSVLFWPNIDAGSDRVSKAIRRFREIHRGFPLHAYKNLPPGVYIPLLTHAACCVGNSSSFVREASFLGTPVVLVGSRQDGRERSPSVVRVDPMQAEIEKAVRRQLEHGKYPVSDLYGSGRVGEEDRRADRKSSGPTRRSVSTSSSERMKRAAISRRRRMTRCSGLPPAPAARGGGDRRPSTAAVNRGPTAISAQLPTPRPGRTGWLPPASQRLRMVAARDSASR